MRDHVSGAETWLVGAGPMAVAYAAVMDALGAPLRVIGRGAASAARFTEQTGHPVRLGGLTDWLRAAPDPPAQAIVATTVDELAQATLALLRTGVRRILVEKPAGLDPAQVRTVADAAGRTGAEVRVAYNRRWYASVARAREALAQDGGVTSFSFEFTELSDKVGRSGHPEAVKRNWFFANSTHIVDLAFFLGGSPRRLTPHVAGALSWHPAGSRFAGAGETEDGALFSYKADWDAPGRWGVELMTSRRRLVLRPIEDLQVQARNAFEVTPVELHDDLDRRFKPGLYRQTEAFLVGAQDPRLLCVAHHAAAMDGVYARILEPSLGGCAT